jgi:hypothetical protein
VGGGVCAGEEVDVLPVGGTDTDAMGFDEIIARSDGGNGDFRNEFGALWALDLIASGFGIISYLL